MTPQILTKCTGSTLADAMKYVEPLSAGMAFYMIDNRERMSMFLSNLGHESGYLVYTTEIWGPTTAQRGYEGRADLGNVKPGDGSLFRGHGLFQTTGRFNHARVRDRLREQFKDVPDFEADPKALTIPQWAALSACDYWDWKNLNALADKGQFEEVVRKINGGVNGLEDRIRLYELSKKVLV